METFSKKRISIIVEESFFRDVLDLVEESGASGFTTYRGIGGEGEHGTRGTYNDIDGISNNVEVVTIVGDEVADRILEGVMALSDRGVILTTYFMNVQVLRDSRFR
ncbi:MAG: hypothetical protein KGZ40_04440 [Clostridiales bacterium]|nr:hypothetical protein [Clostridiales bacterium]